MHLYLLSFTLFFVSSFIKAEPFSLKKLSEDPQWLKLLHYKPNTGQGSYITTSNFFLNKNGMHDPLSELKATILLFESNDDEQCKYPARLLFLQKKYKNFPSIDINRCNDYYKWSKSVNSDSISVIFASGYMSNPASMYGHLFLKINQSSNINKLLNDSLNYGAIVPNNENPLLYIFKGIMGGYDAAYSDKQYFRHHHNYGNTELRDMWEYKLALSKSDVQFIVAHIWELLFVKFDYYFVDENCAFHLAKLIELVLPDTIISNNSLWVLPSSVAKGIVNSKGLLESINFIPSSESIVNDYLYTLNENQKLIGKSLIISDFNFQSNEQYNNLTLLEKTQLVEALLQHFKVTKRSLNDENKKQKLNRLLLKERLQQPLGKAIADPIFIRKKPPHNNQAPSKFSLGFHNIDNLGNYLTLGFRMTYFDDLSQNLTHSKFANLEMFDLEFIGNNNEFKIHKFDLVDIRYFPEKHNDWKLTHDFAWKVRLGYEQFKNDCLNCGNYLADGAIGKSFFYGNSMIYTMVGSKITTGYVDDVQFYGQLGFISHVNPYLNFKFELTQINSLSSNIKNEVAFLSEVNYQLNNKIEMRFFTEKIETTVAGFKVNYFWDF